MGLREIEKRHTEIKRIDEMIKLRSLEDNNSRLTLLIGDGNIKDLTIPEKNELDRLLLILEAIDNPKYIKELKILFPKWFEKKHELKVVETSESSRESTKKTNVDKIPTEDKTITIDDVSKENIDSLLKVF